ncbi:hypothetical protein [[Phormidium] sp. ETS-05]|uniref:hypothetical protein n=1 Tax=[Phormidium] sp. ETS-05 TaxID=222819 RepID=UPI0018EF2E0A|nr:hypothetical protein [[Phormidium] sp. ETS-05]
MSTICKNAFLLQTILHGWRGISLDLSARNSPHDRSWATAHLWTHRVFLGL